MVKLGTILKDKTGKIKEELKQTGTKEASGDGIRSIRTTNLFQIINFELYVKPVSDSNVNVQIPLHINDLNTDIFIKIRCNFQ